MVERDPSMPQGRALAAWRWVAIGLAVLVVVVAVMLPSTALSWLRSDYHWIGAPLEALDEASTPLIDLTHVVLFSMVALVLALIGPRWPWWQYALVLLLLAEASELMQIFAPGRHPRLSDVLDDGLGILVGLICAAVVRSGSALLRR